MKIHFISFQIFIISVACNFASLFSTSAQTASDSIEEYLSNYQYARVLEITSGKLSQNPESKQYLWYSGMANKALYKFSEAINSYKKIQNNDTSNIKIIIEIASTYRLIPDNENALKYYQLALKYDSTNTAFQFEIANCLFSLERFSDALRKYYSLYISDTTNLFLIKRLAMCYFKEAEQDSSILFYNKALALNGNDALSVGNLVNLLILKRKFDEGIKVTEAFQMIDSTNYRINSLNAYLYLLSKNYQIAVNKFNFCLQNNDTSRFVLKNIGIAYFHNLEYDSAKYYLEKSHRMDTLDITNLHFLGLACSKGVYKKLGIEYLEKAIALYEPTIEKIANLYLNTSEACDAWGNCPVDKKIYINHKARYYNPDKNEFIYKLASIYDYKKDTTLAIDYYREYLNSISEEEKITQKFMVKKINNRIEKLQGGK